MKKIFLVLLLVQYIWTGCLDEVRKKIPFLSKQQASFAGCKDDDCRKLPQALQEAWYMICLYEHMDSIQKLKPSFEYAFKKIPDTKEEHIKYVFSMKKPNETEDPNFKDKDAPSFPSKYLIKVCIPVDKSKKAWMDNACALDDCVDKKDAWNKDCMKGGAKPDDE